MTRKHRPLKIALDLDGTMIEKRWPELGPWFPGAITTLRELIDEGHYLYVYSARLSPNHPSGDPKEPALLIQQTHAVRELLDDAGLPEIDIWFGEGKPFWHLLVDDRAMWFPGRPGSWSKIASKIRARLAGEKRG